MGRWRHRRERSCGPGGNAAGRLRALWQAPPRWRPCPQAPRPARLAVNCVVPPARTCAHVTRQLGAALAHLAAHSELFLRMWSIGRLEGAPQRRRQGASSRRVRAYVRAARWACSAGGRWPPVLGRWPPGARTLPHLLHHYDRACDAHADGADEHRGAANREDGAARRDERAAERGACHHCCCRTALQRACKRAGVSASPSCCVWGGRGSLDGPRTGVEGWGGQRRGE